MRVAFNPAKSKERSREMSDWSGQDWIACSPRKTDVAFIDVAFGPLTDIALADDTAYDPADPKCCR